MRRSKVRGSIKASIYHAMSGVSKYSLYKTALRAVHDYFWALNMTEQHEKTAVSYDSDVIHQIPESKKQATTEEDNLDGLRQKIFNVYDNENESHDRTTTQHDIEFIIERIVEMTDEQAIEILLKPIEYHADDQTFQVPLYRKSNCWYRARKSPDLTKRSSVLNSELRLLSLSSVALSRSPSSY